MKIVSTFQKPTSVLSSVKCSLASTPLEHLVVAKLDGLDVYSVQPKGLKHECRWNVWGNILSVKSVPTFDSSRSNLIVLLDHPAPELVFLTYIQSNTGGTLSVTKRLELSERNHNQRPAEFFNDILVHPDGKLALVSCYTGKLKVVVLKNGKYKSDCDASIMDSVIISLAFLPSPDEYAIAILFYDHTRRVRLHARTVVKDNDSSYDISYELSTVLHPTPISPKFLPYPETAVPKLIPVLCPQDFTNTDAENESETFIGGVLLVGGTRILLFEVVSADGQDKQRNKRRKLERAKETGIKAEIEKATQKQLDRDTRKRKPKASVDWPWSEITSWCALDGEPFRYLIGDCFGRLSMLSLHDVPNNGLVLIPLGETSPPTTLSYLANQVLYVGSHAGDSQLVQISSTPLSSSDETPTLPIPAEIDTVPAARLAPPSAKGKDREEVAEPLRDCVLDVKGSYLRVIDTFKNVAPILDATLVDTDNSGHRQIVTCSGGQNTGSIHVMRKGADFHQLATISGMAHTIGVFTLKQRSDDAFDTHILVSTLHETHTFALTTNDTLEATQSMAGFAPGRTLAARNVQRGFVQEAVKRGSTIITPQTTKYEDTSLVVQVTSAGAFLLEYDMGSDAFTQVHNYDITNRGGFQGLQVVAADVNAAQTMLALSNGTLLCLEVDRKNTLVLKSESTQILHHSEVSALSCTPPNPGSNAASSQFVVVAYWRTNDIEILQRVQGSFVSVCTTQPLGAVVRSLLPYNFGTPGEPHIYLLAGLGDGSFVSLSWNEQERKLGEPSVTSLGDLPVHFTPCRVDGEEALFAAGSRAMVLTWQRDSIHQSPVILKEVMAAAQINHEKFESSLLLANESALFIGQVRNVDEMHIRSIPLGLDTPQRIVHEPSLKIFGVACTRREPTRIGSVEPSPRSSFRLLDDTNFNHLSQYNCEADEEITCVTTLTLKEDEDSTVFFCLGTYVFQADEKVPGNGRVLTFTAFPPTSGSSSSNLQLSLAASADVRGCVYSITTIKGLIAVGVDSAIILFQLVMDKETKHCRLLNIATTNLNYFVTSLVGYENRLVVGDQIASISLLELSENGRKLRTLGRDLTPLSPVCVQALNSKHIIAANDTLNLLSFTLDEENRKLDRDGFYQQSDLINKFVPGAITAPDAGSKLEPVQLFFASSGRIGVIIDIADRQLGLDLTSLQRNMANVFEDGPNHTQFRSPQSTARRRTIETAYGFLDGDFLERLLASPPAQLAKIVAGTNEHERLKRPLHEFQQLLKSLQALH